jgi:hypothetical protein
VITSRNYFEMIETELHTEIILSQLTSASAFLIISIVASGLPPGVRAIPRLARTAFFGGGSK